MSCGPQAFLFTAGFVILQSGQACDLCAVFSASQARGQIGPGLVVGVAEQYTRLATLQYEGREVPNSAGQYLESSISQIAVGYNLTERFNLQLQLPAVYRAYQRPEPAGMAVTGTESGIGDLFLLANYQAVLKQTMSSTFGLRVLGGLKFPTGSTSRLREETLESASASGSGIHGHDLTLGTGSLDGLLGVDLFARWQRLFGTGTVQYTVRSEGDYDYQFANDTIWSAGPGFFAVLNDDYTLAVQALASGESKGLDAFRDRSAPDTGMTFVYIGPQVLVTWRDKLSANVGLDLPVLRDNSDLQIVPDYRVRAGLTWHF